MPAGKLDVYVNSANGLKDTEIIGKADPYVILKAEKATGKTSTCKDQGSSPVWGEIIRLRIPNGCKQLVLTIYNENRLYKDDIMGIVTIKLAEVFDPDNKLPDGSFLSPSAEYPVARPDGKIQGKISVALIFEEDGTDLGLEVVQSFKDSLKIFQ
ncbi:elicitor-responsive protein 3 [Physcomitrium patens]|uniref:C2 domain-containing protein n=1 Tax=Physcomitrium patens TaxID=3218 RepID=A9TWW2_PHYPA|nr:elicitor-responsive protein 3-like [Physcomitrium patens]PNR43786.1 hypothetical protein PHYPA_016169 [Physcomitrium patens]|eukprot:XP_024390281.1 elicitor-responsive protein 3-like [Physcomitrella patens]